MTDLLAHYPSYCEAQEAVLKLSRSNTEVRYYLHVIEGTTLTIATTPDFEEDDYYLAGAMHTSDGFTVIDSE